MTVVPAQQGGGGGGSSGLYDVLELVLDRGLVIDAFIRVSLVGIEILKIDVRVVVASVDTYLRFAEACNRLDLEADWSKTLSPGEQQRLAFGRILIARPSLVFLDETTSALDEGMEHSLYERVREQLPDCTLISVGHGSTLDRMHTNELTLIGDGTWETRTLVV